MVSEDAYYDYLLDRHLAAEDEYDRMLNERIEDEPEAYDMLWKMVESKKWDYCDDVSRIDDIFLKNKASWIREAYEEFLESLANESASNEA